MLGGGFPIDMGRVLLLDPGRTDDGLGGEEETVCTLRVEVDDDGMESRYHPPE